MGVVMSNKSLTQNEVSKSHAQLLALFDSMNEAAQIWLMGKAVLLADNFSAPKTTEQNVVQSSSFH
jgi:hypothetical protein